MPSDPIPGPPLLSEVDYASFGNIIQSFAKFEHSITGALAYVSQFQIEKIIIITQGLMFSTKLDTLYSYMEICGTDQTLKDQFKGFFDEIMKYNGLRNGIAHSIWTHGARPKSYKPMSIRIKGGKGKLSGITDDGTERDYTSEELIDISNKLSMLHNSYVRFAIANGMT